MNKLPVVSSKKFSAVSYQFPERIVQGSEAVAVEGVSVELMFAQQVPKCPPMLPRRLRHLAMEAESTLCHEREREL
jgi:hypothetical protein